MEKNKLINDIYRWIIVALLTFICVMAIHIYNKVMGREEVKEIVSTAISDGFALQEWKGNVFYNP